MDKKQLIQYITERYYATEEHPWIKYPNYTVFRHGENKKWFALFMDIPQNRLGLAENKIIDILDVKCDPILVGSLREKDGFYPAYHMNKTNWITVALNGSVNDEEIIRLIDMSFKLTDVKKKHK